MNLLQVFNILTEAAEVNKIKSSVGDKVPASVIDKLTDSAKETKKGKFFDNEAMAIIKSISNGNKDEFLLSHPTAVHGILKKLKSGDSSFDAAKVLSSGEEKEYWKGLYKESKKEKNVEENSFGLKNAKVKSIDDEWFVIIPRIFYKKGIEKELREVDVEKSHKELQSLSNEIAKRDSGSQTDEKAPTWDDRSSSNKSSPNVNHWCVAATDSGYYDSYAKKGPFIFVIFVKKNEDGSPNWDERYLWYTRGEKHGRFGKYETTEFADKFDNYKEESKILSKKAREFLSKNIAPNVNAIVSKKENFIEKIYKDASAKAMKDKEQFYEKNGSLEVEHQLKFDGEIIKYITSKQKELSKEEIRKIGLSAAPWIEEAYASKSLVSFLKDKKIPNNDIFDYLFSENNVDAILISKPLTVGRRVVIFTNNYKQDLINTKWSTYQEFIKGLQYTEDVSMFEIDSKSLKTSINFIRSIINRRGSIRTSVVNFNISGKINALKTPIDVYRAFEPEINVHPNLSKKAQEYFDKAYYSVMPFAKKIPDYSINSYWSSRNNDFYNKDLKLFFFINLDKEKGVYDILYSKIEKVEDKKHLITFDGKNTEEVKAAFKKLAAERKVELEKISRQQG